MLLSVYACVLIEHAHVCMHVCLHAEFITLCTFCIVKKTGNICNANLSHAVTQIH